MLSYEHNSMVLHLFGGKVDSLKHVVTYLRHTGSITLDLIRIREACNQGITECIAI